MADSKFNPLLLSPDYNPDQVAQINRSRLIGQMLMKNAQDKPHGQMIGSVYVAPSWTQHLANLAQGLIGSNMTAQADADEQKYQSKAMQSLFNSGPSDSAINQSSMAQGAAGRNPIASTVDQGAADWMKPYLPESASSNTGPTNANLQLAEALKAQRGSAPDNWMGTGMTGQQAMQAMALGGNLGELLTKNAMPTDQIKNDRWAGITPAQRGAIATGIDMKPNQSRVQIGPDGKPTISMVAPDPESNMQYGVSNGQVTANAIPGAVQSRAAMEGATQAAKQSNSIINVQGPGGEQIPAWGGGAAAAGGNQLGLSGYNGGSRGAADAQSFKILNQERDYALQRGDNATVAQIDRDLKGRFPNGAPAQPTLGQSQGSRLMTETGKNYYDQITKENTNNQQHREILNKMLELANTGKFGPGTDSIAKLKAYASNAGIDLSGAQTDQDIMKKLAANLSMSQLGQGGTGTDSQLQTILNSVPNGGMTNDAMKKVIPMLVSQIDAREARAKAATAHVNQHGLEKLPQFLNDFNNLADPGTISLGRRLAQASKEGKASEVISQLKKERPNDYQQLLKKIRTLDDMGSY